jgi:DNA polymerase I
MKDQVVFDVESDGLLDTVTKLHCINVIDRATDARLRFNTGRYFDPNTGEDLGECTRDGSIEDGVEYLRGKHVAGQNIIGYDIPVLEKLYPGFQVASAFDTKVCSAVIWPDLMDRDFEALRKGTLPEEFQKKRLVGRNSLAAWGYRLGCHKGDFDPKAYGHDWSSIPFCQDMDEYCVQDNEVALKWIELIESKAYSQECLHLEHDVAEIIGRQERHGFAFDVAGAERLVAKLQVRRAEIETQLQDVFPPWQVLDKDFIAKVNNAKLGRKKGDRVRTFKTLVFNPGSRDHIASRLSALYGWEPEEFTDGGKPKVDEAVLGALPYPEAKLLAEYLMVAKRIGQIAEGREAWLRNCVDGRVYGRVNTNGAVTGRMTHFQPNMAQVPNAGSLYGPECRALFRASPLSAAVQKALVGCDAEGLELRVLAHYMARWDDGAYADVVVNGRKEDESDVHNVNKRAAGLQQRDSAKTFIYALIYGAGDEKLGSIVYEDGTDEQRAAFLRKYTTKAARAKALRKLGAARRARIMENLPALGELVRMVKRTAKERGYLIGLDGRRLHVRSDHSSLNTLLQSGGAIVMKKALVLFDREVARHPELVGQVYYVANVHDEFQLETEKDIANTVGQLAADAIRRAGEHFKFRCPLAGAYAVGETWKDTH